MTIGTTRPRPKDGLDEERLLETIRHARLPLCITDPTLPDNPIVFANAAFCELTGYGIEEVLGRNCRFLQGPGTTPESVAAIRAVIAGGEVDTVEIVNYRKDGSSFVNALQIGPIPGEDGAPALYFGSQLDTSTRRESERQARELADRELGHRLRNIVNVMSVMIRMSVSEAEDVRALARIVEGRLKTLGEAHFRTIEHAGRQAVRLRALLRPILDAYAPRGDRQYDFTGADPEIDAEIVSALTLTVHELATNSVKHGALGDAMGRVEIAVEAGDGTGEGAGLRLDWRERGGPAVTIPERQGGAGIIDALVRGSGGRLELDWRPEGLAARLEFPEAP